MATPYKISFLAILALLVSFTGSLQVVEASGRELTNEDTASISEKKDASLRLRANKHVTTSNSDLSNKIQHQTNFRALASVGSVNNTSNDPGAPTLIDNGVPETGLAAAAGQSVFFLFTTILNPGDKITCNTECPIGDANLGITDDSTFITFLCIATTPDTSEETCSVTATTTMNAYVRILANGANFFSGLTLQCEYEAASDSGGDDDDSGCGCFSGETTVDVEGKGMIPIKDVAIGDHVLTSTSAATGSVYEPIFGFGHYHETAPTKFVQIHYSEYREGRATRRPGNPLDDNSTASVWDKVVEPLEMTANHLVFVEGKTHPIRAGSVEVQDRLLSSDRNRVLVVTKISEVSRTGVYAPLTPSGTLVVSDSGVVASTYVSIQDSSPEFVALGQTPLLFLPQQTICHLWMTPYRLFCMMSSSSFCKGESYTERGRSWWVHGGKELVAWGESHPMVLQVMLLLIVCAHLLCFAALEKLILAKWTTHIVTISLLIVSSFIVKRKTGKLGTLIDEKSTTPNPGGN